MPAIQAIPVLRAPPVLNGNGNLNGHVVRPLRDSEPEVPNGNALLTASECKQLRLCCEPLARAEQELQALDEQQRDVRISMDAAERASLPKIVDRAEAIKAGLPVLRGDARAACLVPLRAARARAGAKLMAAAAIWAEAAAEYVGLGQLEDELRNVAEFDPSSYWQLVGAVLAPKREDMPKGRYTVPDAYGRECAWTSNSPAHLDAVRRVKASFTAQMQPALCGARLPF